MRKRKGEREENQIGVRSQVGARFPHGVTAFCKTYERGM